MRTTFLEENIVRIQIGKTQTIFFSIQQANNTFVDFSIPLFRLKKLLFIEQKPDLLEEYSFLFLNRHVQ